MKKRLAPLILAVPLLLAGCASGTEDTPEPSPTTTVESTTSATVTSAEISTTEAPTTEATTTYSQPPQSAVVTPPVASQAEAPGAEDLILISEPSEMSLAIYMHPDDGATYVCDDRGTNPYIELGANGCAGPMSYSEAQQVVGQGFVDALEEAGSEIAEANGETFTP